MKEKKSPDPNNPSAEVSKRYRDVEVASKYDQQRYADLQGRMNNRVAWRALRRALCFVRGGGRLLDIPCGTGRFTRQLAMSGFDVVASDVSGAMLALARQTVREDVKSRVQFIEGDIFHLSYADRTFAGAVCIRFFNLVDRPRRLEALREMARVAEVVIASYYHKYTFKYAGRWLRQQVGLHKGNNPRLTRAELWDEIGQSGLEMCRLIPVAPLLSEEWLVVLRPYGNRSCEVASQTAPLSCGR